MGAVPNEAPRRCSRIKKGCGRAYFVAADLARVGEVQRLADEVGPVDILINTLINPDQP
jgi:hypothetical protein